MAQENKIIYYPIKEEIAKKSPREIFKDYFIKDDGKTTFVEDFNEQLNRENPQTGEPFYPGLVVISGKPLSTIIVKLSDQVNVLAKVFGYKINAHHLAITLEKILLSNIGELENIVRSGKTEVSDSSIELKEFFITTLIQGVTYIRENNLSV